MGVQFYLECGGNWVHAYSHEPKRQQPMTVLTGERLHVLSGLRNLVEPDVEKLAGRLRGRATDQAEQLRHDAPLVISRAAEWVMDNAREIADSIFAGATDVPFSRAMLLEAFGNTLRRWQDVERLTTFVREETHGIAYARPIFPQVVFHNLAGNLFVSGWESITYATLLGAASLVRCSENDRVFPAVWALAISKFSPLGSDAVAVCEWPRNDYGRFAAAAETANATVCFGGDQAVRAVRETTPWNKPFAGHGAAVSFSIIMADELRHNPVEWLAERCAYDIAVYDQQGCLSPRAVFVEDVHSRDVDRFVDALHGALVNWEKVLPRRRITLEDSAALARARDAVLLDAACGGPSRRVSVDKDPFLLTVKPVGQFSLGPVDRYADLYLFKDIEEVRQVLAPLQGHLSSLGVVEPKRMPVALASALKVPRICELGQMQRPPLAWALDGYRPLQKMLRWQSVQAG
jgi:acyl-CoA reductase-like NAD-dependent aldehyde dehydrogenase